MDSRVTIIGGGAWGLSTALHLMQAGFTNLTVFERSERMPSRYSAGWDINKIVRAEYEDKFYTQLALVSLLLDRFRRDNSD
jgi:sarcosine oxidase/L-pipecolate oxidase